MIARTFETIKTGGQKASDFVVRLTLTLIYFSFLAPLAIWESRIRRRDTSKPKGDPRSYWVDRNEKQPTLEDARRGC